MPFYHKLGKIPHKRHIQFRKEDGSLYYEQLFGTIGFDGMSSNMYHIHRPTQVKEIRNQYSVAPKIAKANNIQSYRLRGFEVAPENDFLESQSEEHTSELQSREKLVCRLLLEKKNTQRTVREPVVSMGTRG